MPGWPRLILVAIGMGLAASYLVANTGRLWLRQDRADRNTRLHEYYRQLGFTHLQTVALPHR
jgi:hypothetical protein